MRYFKFIGRVIGRAIFEGRPIAYHWAPYIYKCIVCLPLTFNDLENSDEPYFNVLQSLDKVQDISSLGLNFTITEKCPFGGPKNTVELVIGGYDLSVTKHNFHDYKVALMKYLLIGRVRLQLKYFVTGINDVIPMGFLHIFNSHELEALMTGSLDN